MNAAHIVSTSLKAANAAADAATAAAKDAPAEGDAAAFGLMLGEQIDAALLLDEKAAAPTEAGAGTPAAPVNLVDPNALGLPLPGIPPVPRLLGKESGDIANQANEVVLGMDVEPKAAGKSPLPVAAVPSRGLKDIAATEQTSDTPLLVTASTVAVVDAKPATVSTELPPSLAALSNAHQATTSRSVDQAPTLNLSQQVGSERWNNELGQTVTLMIKGEQTRASLQVTPPEMGPIEIKIDLSGDEASISFTVQQTDTRQALENALPRLREMLAESGISLGQSQVNHQSANQGQGEGEKARTALGGNEVQTQVDLPTQTRIGLVDTFA
ncbi:MAG TPA: flagellar hook-length control protein FliK [Burkholderiales bacterium]|nr:flagellar hook-length control protein FliK [Burkholderiales bacterium]